MKDILSDYSSEIEDIEAELSGRTESGFYPLILKDTLTRGTPAAKGKQKRLVLAFLSDFYDKLPDIRSFSFLPYILSLPEQFPLENEGEGESQHSQPTNAAVAYDGDIIEEVLISILADEGVLFFEVRPPVYGELSGKDSVIPFSRGDRLIIESSTTIESKLIDQANEEFESAYPFYTKDKKGKWVHIISYWIGLANPDGDNWLRKCLTQIFQHNSSFLKQEKIDLREYYSQNAFFSEDQLKEEKYCYKTDGGVVLDGYQEPRVFTLADALDNLSDICNRLIRIRKENISWIIQFNNISEEAYRIYSNLIKVKEDLKIFFDSPSFLICNYSRLDDYLEACVKEAYPSRDSTKMRQYFPIDEKEQENIQRNEFKKIRRQLYTLFCDYYTKDEQREICLTDCLKQSIDNILAVSFMDMFSIDQAEDSSEGFIPITLGPVIIYLLFQKYHKKMEKKVFSQLPARFYSALKKKTFDSDTAKRDFELYLGLCNIYKIFYGKRCTTQVVENWNGAFLVLSGYRGLYASELIFQVQSILPSVFCFERILVSLKSNRPGLIHEAVLRARGVVYHFSPEKAGDPGWETVSYLKHILKMDMQTQTDSILEEFKDFLYHPYSDQELQDFLEKALDRLIKIDGNKSKEEAYREISERYGLTEISQGPDPDKIYHYKALDHYKEIKDPKIFCTIALEYTMRLMLEERCCLRLYSLLSSYIDYKYKCLDLFRDGTSE